VDAKVVEQEGRGDRDEGRVIVAASVFSSPSGAKPGASAASFAPAMRRPLASHATGTAISPIRTKSRAWRA